MLQGTAITLTEADASLIKEKRDKRVQNIVNENISWRRKYPDLMGYLDGDGAVDRETRRRAEVAKNTLMVMENQLKALIGMKSQPAVEATFNANLNTLVPKVIDLVRIFYPNLIANLLVDIQPMDRQNGEVFIVKPIYSNTAAGVTAGQQVFQNITDGTYASEELTLAIATGDGSHKAYTASFSPVPIKAGSVTVVTSDGGKYTDDGAGNLVTITDSSSGGVLTVHTVSYTTGLVSITFTNNITSGVTVTGTALWDYETGSSNLRSLEIQLGLYPVTARAHPLNVKWSQTAELAAAAHLDLNVPDVLANLVASFIKQERDVQLINRILATSTHETSLDFDATPPSNYSRLAKYAEIELKINRAESIIQNALGRGGVSWVMGGINVTDILRQTNGFKATPVVAPIGPHKIGEMRDGTLDVIKVPFMDPDTYVIGFKGYVVGDSATILAEWVPLYATPVFKAPDLTNSQGMMSLYALVSNNTAYYRTGLTSNYAA